VDAANADFTKARNELDRQTQLHRRGVISQSELDRFQRAFGVAEAAQREAQRALDDTRMLAPFDGRVARTLVNNFQNVQARQPVLIFQNNASLEVDIQIPESDMSLGSQGLTAENARDRIEARVEFPAIPGQSFDLELKSFGTEASRSARTFPVTFNLPPPAGQNILPGMTCTVLVRLKTQGPDQPAAEGLFQVPIRAVATVDGTSSVWKLDTTTMKVSKIPVEMGAVTGETVSVKTSSLRPGDEIVISGVRFLSEGMVVQRFQN
jgi:RND family efflux transporter MFP subunit